MTGHDTQALLKQIEDNAALIGAETGLLFSLRAFAIGLASKTDGRFSVPPDQVGQLGTVSFLESNIENLAKNFLVLLAQKKAVLNQRTDPISAVIVASQNAFTTRIEGASTKVTVPTADISLNQSDGTYTITLPQVNVNIDADVIAVPRAVMTGDADPDAGTLVGPHPH
jgi:hypothetical protein